MSGDLASRGWSSQCAEIRTREWLDSLKPLSCGAERRLGLPLEHRQAREHALWARCAQMALTMKWVQLWLPCDAMARCQIGPPTTS